MNEIDIYIKISAKNSKELEAHFKKIKNVCRGYKLSEYKDEEGRRFIRLAKEK